MSFSQDKELIDISKVYYPVRVNGSPWDAIVSIGKSTPSLSYYEGPTSVKAGDTNTMKFYSLNTKGELLDNTADEYTSEFLGVTETITLTSSYVSDGMSQLDYILRKAGIYTVSVKLYDEHIKDSPFQLTVSEGDASAEFSITDLKDYTGVTVGEEVIILFTPKDMYENQITGTVDNVKLDILFQTNTQYDSPIGAPYPADWETIYGVDYSGYYFGTKFTYTVFRAGTYNAIATIEDTELGEGVTTVSAVPGELYGKYCVIYNPPDNAVAGDSYEFQVQTRDRFHNNLQISSVTESTVTATGPGTVTGGLAYDNLLGIFRGALVLTKSGSYSIQVSINGQALDPISDVTINPKSTTSPTKSYIENIPSSIETGVSTVLTLYSLDEYENLRTGSSDTFGISITSPTNTVSGISVTNKNDGSYDIEFIILEIGTYTLSVSLDGTLIEDPAPIFEVTTSAVRAENSIVVDYDNSQVAGTVELVITAKDLGGNTVNNPVNSDEMGQQYFFIDVAGPQVSQYTADYVDTSQFLLDLTALTRIGEYSLVLSLIQSGGLLGFYYADAEFILLEKTELYPNHVGSTLDSYTAIDSTINLNWGTSIPSYFTTNTPDFFSIKWTGKLFIETTEEYTFYISTNNLVSFTVSSSVLIDTISTNIVNNTPSSKISLVSNTFNDIEIRYKSGSGESYITLEWETVSISKTIIPSSNLFATLTSQSSPYSLSIIPAETNAIGSLLLKEPTDADPLKTAYVLIEKKFIVEARDRYGNLQVHTTDIFDVTLTKSGANFDVLLVSESLGIYAGSFTPPESGTFALKVFFGGVLADNELITVEPGTTDPLQTEVTTLGDIEAGTQGISVIILKDGDGNQQATGGDEVTVRIEGTIEDVPTGQITVKDLNDGTYEVRYKIYIVSEYNFAVTVNSVLGVTVAFNVFFSSISVIKSSYSTVDTTSLGDTITGDIFLKDKYSNIYQDTPAILMFLTKESNDNFKRLFFVISEVNITLGHFSGTADFTQENVDEQGICADSPSDPSLCDFTGSLILWAYIIEPNVIARFYQGTD